MNIAQTNCSVSGLHQLSFTKPFCSPSVVAAGTVGATGAVAAVTVATVGAGAVATITTTGAVAGAAVTVATIAAGAIAAIATIAATEAVALIGAAIRALSVGTSSAALNLDAISTVSVSDASFALMASALVEVLESSNAASAVLVTLVATVGVLELFEVSVATTNASNSLDISGVESLVGDTTGVVVVVLVAEVVVVSTVVPGTKVVGPAAISVVGVVLVAVGVGSWGIAERVAGESDGVTNITRGVLVTLVADTSLLLTVVRVVVTRDGVEGDIDLAGVVAPLVVNGLLGIPVVVGAPLVPGVVDPLVVALTLMAGLSVGVVGIGAAFRAVSTVSTGVTLVAVGLVVGTIGSGLLVVVLDVSLPGLNGNDSGGKKHRLEHFLFRIN